MQRSLNAYCVFGNAAIQKFILYVRFFCFSFIVGALFVLLLEMNALPRETKLANVHVFTFQFDFAELLLDNFAFENALTRDKRNIDAKD